VLAEWRLEDLFAARALDDLTGAVLLGHEPNPDYDERFPALLSDVVPWPARGIRPVQPGYDRRRVEPGWLKIEAVFMDRQDRLAEWSRDLAPRLAAIVRRAQDGQGQ
jgi:hypothetical protein